MMTDSSSLGGDRVSIDFWSSTEHPSFLPGLTHALTAYGWACRARFAISEADYRSARGRRSRLALRWQAYFRYPWSLRRALRTGARADVSVVCTNTFYAPWVAMRAARRRSVPVVHWVFDLFPDVIVLAGAMRRGSWGERCLRSLVRATFDRAALNVFLGERLRSYAEAQFGPISRSVVILVGCDARPFAGVPPVSRAVGEPVRALYCGNLGRMHDVDTIFGALHAGLPETLELNFRGNGAGFRLLEDAMRTRNFGGRISIGGNLKESDWIEAMCASDVALVTMKPGAEGVVMPSKTYSALAAGQAVVAICPDASDLADTIRKHDCGWVVAPGDVEKLGNLFVEIVNRPDELLRRRQNAWRAGQQVFDQRVLAGAWNAVFEAALKYNPRQNDEACV